MIRKINFTARKRIKRNDVEILLLRENGNISFEANLMKLHEYDFPKDSHIFLEAYRISNWQRFSLGKLSSLTETYSDHLNGFGSPEGIRFRVKVIDNGISHKLIAKADSIPFNKPDEEEIEVIPILPVVPSDELDYEIFRVDFSGDYPILLINSNVGNYKEIARSAAFISLVYPSVFKEILEKIFLIDKQIEMVDYDEWHTKWLIFLKHLPGLGDLPKVDQIEDCYDYIQRAIEVFAKKIDSRHKFIDFWSGEE
jgi:hypothetical protein